MKLLLFLLALTSAAFAQFNDARSLQHRPIKPGLTCAADAYVLTWVAANNQFECLVIGPGSGVTSIAGTANQIVASAATGAVVLSLATGVPAWTKCTVTNSTTNLVVSGTGCTAATIAKAGATTQTIPLFALPANGFVQGYVEKSSTAFAGTTTLKAGLGTTGTPEMFLISSTGYDMNAAVSATNLSTALPLLNGSDTTSATSVVLPLTSTGANISSVSTGVLDVWALWSIRP